MSSRLWYPQLDVFDTARRMLILLHDFENSPGIERLCIADFFLATPELLHKTTMKADDRKKFMELKIIRPEKSFISYPSAPLLFHKMEGIQKEAINTLSARGLISIEKYKQGYLELTGFGRSVFDPHRMSTEQELSMSYFITHFFANEEEIANYNLRRRTGLRRIT